MVFVRDRNDIEILSNKIINIKNTIFVCLTFEAFYEAKYRKYNYTYAYKLKDMHKVDFLSIGKSNARNFIKKLFRKKILARMI